MPVSSPSMVPLDSLKRRFEFLAERAYLHEHLSATDGALHAVEAGPSESRLRFLRDAGALCGALGDNLDEYLDRFVTEPIDVAAPTPAEEGAPPHSVGASSLNADDLMPAAVRRKVTRLNDIANQVDEEYRQLKKNVAAARSAGVSEREAKLAEVIGWMSLVSLGYFLSHLFGALERSMPQTTEFVTLFVGGWSTLLDDLLGAGVLSDRYLWLWTTVGLSLMGLSLFAYSRMTGGRPLFRAYEQAFDPNQPGEGPPPTPADTPTQVPTAQGRNFRLWSFLLAITGLAGFGMVLAATPEQTFSPGAFALGYSVAATLAVLATVVLKPQFVTTEECGAHLQTRPSLRTLLRTATVAFALCVLTAAVISATRTLRGEPAANQLSSFALTVAAAVVSACGLLPFAVGRIARDQEMQHDELLRLKGKIASWIGWHHQLLDAEVDARAQEQGELRARSERLVRALHERHLRERAEFLAGYHLARLLPPANTLSPDRPVHVRGDHPPIPPPPGGLTP